MSRWVRTWTGTGRDQGEWTESIGGREWFTYAQRMDRWDRLLHWRHRPQTRGVLAGGMKLIERCKCGLVRLDGRGPWTELEG